MAIQDMLRGEFLTLNGANGTVVKLTPISQEGLDLPLITVTLTGTAAKLKDMAGATLPTSVSGWSRVAGYRVKQGGGYFNFSNGAVDPSGALQGDPLLTGSKIAPGISASIPFDPAGTAPASRFLSNPNGLQRWYQSLQYVLTRGAGIVFAGDSVAEGTRSNSYLWGPSHHKLKVLLQAKYNAPGTGGYGLIRAATGLTASDIGGWAALASDIHDWLTVGGGGTHYDGISVSTLAGALVQMQSSSGTIGQRIIWDGADPVNNRKCTGFDLLCNSGAAVPTALYKVTGTAAAFDASSGGSAFSFSGSAVAGSRFYTGPRNLTADAYKHIGVFSNGGMLNLEGIYVYNNDYNSGIHVVNIANWGSKVDMYTDATRNTAQITRFMQGGGGAPTNCKLFILKTGINEQIGAMATATFQASLITACQAVEAVGGCVLLINEIPKNGVTAAQWAPYRDAVMAAAAAQPSTRAVLDEWAYFGDPLHGGNAAGGFMFDKGWYADGTHPNDDFYTWEATLLFSILTDPEMVARS